MALAAGSRLGPYRIDAQLGAGGMGQVYRATDTRLDRLVAIKVIAPQVTADQVARSRFEREAKIVSSLDHPNICAIYDVGAHDDGAFLVMQYLEGRTLAEVIPTRPTLDEVRRIAADLAAALTCAHGRGILHRDIKPQNIMVLPDGRAMLLDFGIARSQMSPTDVTIAETREGLTAAGAVMGTLEYMSPEQLAGRAVDARSDIFSLGLVLHELATGRHPYRRETLALTVSALLTEPLAPDTTGLPAPVASVLTKMIARNPRDRYGTAAECLADLKALQHTLTDVRPHAAPRRTGLAVAVGVAVLAIGAMVALREPPEPATPSAVASATPAAAATPAPATTLTYWLDVRPNADGAVFQSLGDHILPGGARVRLNTISSAAGYLYLVNVDRASSDNPTGLAILYAGNVATAVTTNWFVLSGGPAAEQLWLIWSPTVVTELAGIAPLLNERDRGIVRDPVAAQQVRALLGRTPTSSEETRDPIAVRATLRASAAPIVRKLELQHA